MFSGRRAVIFVLAAVPAAGRSERGLGEGHPGNRATGILVGMGSGPETAKIHCWLTDKNGGRVNLTDTIRSVFSGNEHRALVGQPALPFADRIATRLALAKFD